VLVPMEPVEPSKTTFFIYDLRLETSAKGWKRRLVA